jgi:hypothetical protein
MRQPTANPDALDRATPLVPIAAVLLALAVVAGLDACHPRLPPVSGCTPYARRCAAVGFEVCSASRRWEPVGDMACDHGCELLDGGRVRCAAAPDASASDGGAE